VSDRLHVSAASLLREQPPDAIGLEAGWVTEQVLILRKENSCPYRDSNPYTLALEPVDSRYTDGAMPVIIKR
jgi:hypothetical protein